MKKIFRFFFLIFAIFSFFSLFSCASNKTVEENGREYSSRTVIVSLAKPLSDDEAEILASDFDCTLLYNMKNLTMCSLAAKKPLSAEELSDLMARLEKDGRVLSAMRDEILHLD